MKTDQVVNKVKHQAINENGEQMLVVALNLIRISRNQIQLGSYTEGLYIYYHSNK